MSIAFPEFVAYCQTARPGSSALNHHHHDRLDQQPCSPILSQRESVDYILTRAASTDTQAYISVITELNLTFKNLIVSIVITYGCERWGITVRAIAGKPFR